MSVGFVVTILILSSILGILGKAALSVQKTDEEQEKVPDNYHAM